MAKRFAIRGRKGDYAFFTKSPEETMKKFLDSKPFGHEWADSRNTGVALVQVDIREVAVLDGEPLVPGRRWGKRSSPSDSSRG